MELKAQNLTLSGAARTEYGEVSKYVNFKGSDGKKAKAEMNQDAIDKDLRLAGYNMLVTSEVKMSDKDIYDTYHNLWRIEESFKIMKSDLDARPVFLEEMEKLTDLPLRNLYLSETKLKTIMNYKFY